MCLVLVWWLYCIHSDCNWYFLLLLLNISTIATMMTISLFSFDIFFLFPFLASFSARHRYGIKSERNWWMYLNMQHTLHDQMNAPWTYTLNVFPLFCVFGHNFSFFFCYFVDLNRLAAVTADCKWVYGIIWETVKLQTQRKHSQTNIILKAERHRETHEPY